MYWWRWVSVLVEIGECTDGMSVLVEMGECTGGDG